MIHVLVIPSLNRVIIETQNEVSLVTKKNPQ